MVGLRGRLFKNLTMGFKIGKSLTNLLHSEGNAFDDIVEVIVALKMTIHELEDLGRKV